MPLQAVTKDFDRLLTPQQSGGLGRQVAGGALERFGNHQMRRALHCQRRGDEFVARQGSQFDELSGKARFLL